MKLLNLFLCDLQEKLLLHLHNMSCWWQGQESIIQSACPQEENENHYIVDFFCKHFYCCEVRGNVYLPIYQHCNWPKLVLLSFSYSMRIHILTCMVIHSMQFFLRMGVSIICLNV